uniref:Intermediate filament protein D n=1 Tax=Molgula oculata TaxID=27575 RepID=Q95PQ6_MOLOC|nr:intermediate filament protein D [Molgula oculata]
MKLNEKELLNGLNSRFATYIEKVRYLEEQNKGLEKKIKAASKKKEVDLGQEKLENLRKLRAQVDDAALAKVKAEIARDNLRGEAAEIKWKLDHEAQLRGELDDELTRLRKDVDDATMVRVDLERKIETLREELEYNRKIHNDEIEDLKDQIANQGVNIEVDGIAPDVAELLRQIRQQYETIVAQNQDEAEQWYKKKFEDLDDKSKNNAADLEKVRNEIGDYRKQVTQHEMELESLRGTNDYLERNLAEVEKRYENEVSRYQDRITKISGDLDNATAEMKKHLAEYERLMSVKQSLEREIQTYRQLLEGDGKRRASSSDSSTSSDEDEDDTVVRTKRKVVIKTIETRDGKIVSSSTKEKDVEDGSGTSSSSENEEE